MCYIYYEYISLSIPRLLFLFVPMPASEQKYLLFGIVQKPGCTYLHTPTIAEQSSSSTYSCCCCNQDCLFARLSVSQGKEGMSSQPRRLYFDQSRSFYYYYYYYYYNSLQAWLRIVAISGCCGITGYILLLRTFPGGQTDMTYIKKRETS